MMPPAPTPPPAPQGPKGPRPPKIPLPQGPRAPVHPVYHATQAKAGRAGRAVNTERQQEAARLNGARPCGPGKKRGRPRKDAPPPGPPPNSAQLQTLEDQPSEFSDVCPCGAEAILSVRTLKALEAGKPFVWDCPECRRTNERKTV